MEDQLSRIKALRLATLDNATVLFAGDENSRSEVTEFISLLNGLADRLGIGIILSAHASKSQSRVLWVNSMKQLHSFLRSTVSKTGNVPSSNLIPPVRHCVI